MDSSSEGYFFVIKPSTIPEAGVGVFTLSDIPTGAKLGIFLDDFSEKAVSAGKVPYDLQAYCINKGEGKLLCPKDFNQMNIGNYVNHSNESNVKYVKEVGYIATIDLKSGDELFVDYGQVGDVYEVSIEDREPYVNQ